MPYLGLGHQQLNETHEWILLKEIIMMIHKSRRYSVVDICYTCVVFTDDSSRDWKSCKQGCRTAPKHIRDYYICIYNLQWGGLSPEFKTKEPWLWVTHFAYSQPLAKLTNMDLHHDVSWFIQSKRHVPNSNCQGQGWLTTVGQQQVPNTFCLNDFCYTRCHLL